MSLLHTNVFDDVAGRLSADINPYVRKLLEGAEKSTLPLLYGPMLKGLAGRWRERFSVSGASGRPLILEIGCHLGKTLREMATAHPEIDFVGMDITFKRVVTAAERAADARLTNVHVILGSALQLDTLAGCGELDGVVLFFPDPWSKRRKQKRNRLLSPGFCASLRGVLAPGGFFWFKTDHQEYFAAAVEQLKAAGFVRTKDLPGLPSEAYESTFERKFRLAGLPIHESLWVNPSTKL